MFWKMMILFWTSIFLWISCDSSGFRTSAASVSRDVLLENIKSFGYQLQNLNMDEIRNSDYDLIIIDYSENGLDENAFTEDEVNYMKGEGEKSKLLLAYLSIGEAEDYRFYFDPNIDYLDEENPNWPGNYKVRYWMGAWQQIIRDYLDKILAAGFNGVYLDLIDAYQYYAPGGESGLERESAAQEMAHFVIIISQYARQLNPNFLVFPQNGTPIIDDSGMEEEYFKTIDGVGVEDLFYYGDKPMNNDLNIQQFVISYLDVYRSHQKLVLSLDYLSDAEKIRDYCQRAKTEGYIPYPATRQLETLITFTYNECW